MTVKVPPCRTRLDSWAGLRRGDEVRVEGFKGLHEFLAAVCPLDSEVVDHVEVLVRGAVRSLAPDRIRNRFGYPVIV
jgi:hypothetical protein